MHKRDWALFIIVVWIAAGLRAYQIFELGGQSDEGVHVVVVQQLLRGADLYSELFENRTPGVFWLLTALAQLLPADLLTLRWVTWGMGLITTAGLWSLGRTLTRSSWGGVLAAVLYATAPLPVLWDRYVMLEPYVTAFTVLGMLAAVKGARNADMVSALLAGLFSGAAVLMKQSAVMMLPAIGLFLLVNRQQPRPIKRRLFFSWLSGGAGMALLLLLGLLVTDGLHPFVATLSGLDRLAGGDGIAVKLSALGQIIDKRPLAPLALVGIGSLLWKRPFGYTLLLGWVLMESAAIWLPPELDLQPGGFSHYVLPAAAALAAAAAVGIVWGGRSLHPPGRWGWLLILGAMTVWTIPGWWVSLGAVTWNNSYPQQSQADEQRIGRSLAALSSEEQSVLVLGNSIVYYWAERYAQNYFGHYPGYFTNSEIGNRADMEIAATLRAQEPAVVVVSRMHFEERLSPTVRDALWSAWVPVNLFAYPYQRDMFLFLPVDKGAELLSAPTAVFDHGVRLQDVAAFSLPGADALLVRLRWRAPDPLAASYTIFAHLLDRSGQLVAQKDSIPVAGWRPTTSWGAGEIITDWRWIPLERAIDPQTMQLSIGLYDSMDGSRLALAHPDGASGGDQFVTSLNFVMEPWNE